MRKVLFVLFIVIYMGHSLIAQEVLFDLPYNPVLTSYTTQKSLKMVSETVKLPFFDDFSQTKIDPDTSLWNNIHSIYVNNNYSRGNPSIGVATFDAVGLNGHHHNNASSTPFEADRLTSQPIDLSQADLSTTWLSFYYQPQGYGNAPEFNDSLILEFTGQGADWHTVWYANGSEFLDFRENVLGIDPTRTIDTNEFKLVMIPVDSTVYQSSEFRFRFKNYASLASDNNLQARVNCDHWNIDYVYLNENRNANDTVFNDVAFVKEPNSFLRLFESVPWSHYQAVQTQELSLEYLYMRNNGDSRVLLTATEFLIDDIDSHEKIDSFNVGALNIEAYENYDFSWKFDQDPLFEVEGKSELNAEYELRLTTNDDFPQNNSTTKEFHFLNYYAYDDGSAENAYGVQANEARVAVRFESYEPDALMGVSMYFLQTEPAGEGAASFNLCVWDDDNGTPGDTLLMDEGIEPEFSSDLNKFVQYEFSSPIQVDGPFYIGWMQKSALRMNVGFDKNNNNKKQLFYNIYGFWENTEFSGSLMMRPLMGYITGNATKLAPVNGISLQVYPNPATDEIYLQGIDSDSQKQVSIYSTLGQLQKIINVTSESINVSDLQRGVYVVSVTTIGGESFTTKLVINK